jgi:hypothetical protein
MIPITNPAQLPKEHAYQIVSKSTAEQAILDGATVYALTHVTLGYTEYFVVKG